MRLQTIASISKGLLFAASGIVLVYFAGHSAVVSASTGDAQLRIFVSEEANPLFVRDSIISIGGRIHGYAPERAFVIAIDADAVQDLRLVEGITLVKKITPSELVATESARGLGLGALPITPDEQEFIDDNFTRIKVIAPNTLAEERALLDRAGTRPFATDNSISQHFPPIGSQDGQGSCTGWATCYYYNTFTQALDEGVDVSAGIADPVAVSYIGSPGFLYNLENDGVDGGAVTSEVVYRLNQTGCSSWQTKPYSSSDYTSWPTEAAWVDALKFRTETSNVIYLDSEAGIEALKQHLANGSVAVTRADVYSNWYRYGDLNTSPGIDNGVLFSDVGEVQTGSHALTFVGYDDYREYNDQGDIKRGAFLVSNSWGPTWGFPNSTDTGTAGFIWVAYEYVTSQKFDVALFNNDRDDYRPRLYATAGLFHPERWSIAYRGGLFSVYDGSWFSYFPINIDGGAIPIDETKPVAVDLTDGLSMTGGIRNATLFVEMTVYSSSEGEIRSANFYHDLDGNDIYERITSSDPVVTVFPYAASVAEAAILIFPPAFQLSDLDGRNGFSIHGVDAGDATARSVRNAGDINGDGIDDLLLGAPEANPDTDDEARGASYVVFGRDTASEGNFPAGVELTALDGSNGFALDGADYGDHAGNTVSGAGDLNGDGIDDLVIASPGSVWTSVVFGRDTGSAGDFPARVTLGPGSLDGSNGFSLEGPASNSVSAAGDINGDLIADLILGAQEASSNGEESGASFVVFGRDTAVEGNFPAVFKLSALDGSNGFVLNGAFAGDHAGRSVRGAGDINHDGVADLLIGANGVDSNGEDAGAGYLVFGRDTAIEGEFPASLELPSLNGRNGFVLNGVSAGDAAGISVSGAGDVNGDGIDDLLIGAPDADPNGDRSGSSYLVFGRDTATDGDFPASIELSTLEGSNGFAIHGEGVRTGGDRAGFSVSGAGDINDDGLGDVIIGAIGANRSYVVFGRDTESEGEFPATVELSALNGGMGFAVHGASVGDGAGRVSGAGDINHDGVADLLIGAPGADPNGDYSGAGYVVYGLDSGDADRDGIADEKDNCVLQPNGPLQPDAGGHIQRDTDNDRYGNVCDPDLNNSGNVDFADLAYLKSMFFTSDSDADLDGDGKVDFADLAIQKSMFFGPPGPSGPADLYESCEYTISLGQSISGVWESACESTHRPGSYANYYMFELSISQQVTIDLESSTDTYLFLLDGADRNSDVITEDDDGGQDTNSHIRQTLPAGTYTIEATTYSPAEKGIFSLSIY